MQSQGNIRVVEMLRQMSKVLFAMKNALIP